MTLILAQHSNHELSFAYLFQNSYFVFVKQSSHVYFMLSLVFFPF